MRSDADGWVTRWSPAMETRHRLLCFPYAGASGLPFRAWQPSLPSGVEVCAVELPGRWHRQQERAISSVSALTDRLVEALAPLTDLPFSIYGHSFGSLLGFEFARELRRRSGRLPRIFFAAACKAPDLPAQLPWIHRLPEQEFLLACARRYNAFDERLIADDEVRAIMAGPMRADLTALESYRYTEASPLECELQVFGGRLDPSVRDEELRGWARHGRRGASLAYLPGGHLFLKDQAGALLEQVRAALNRHLVQGADQVA